MPPIAREHQKLVQIQHEINFPKKGDFIETISSNSDKESISLLNKILARVIFKGLTNHSSSTLHRNKRPAIKKSMFMAFLKAVVA